MYSIYALIDPRDNTVRYVGLTDDVYKRFVQHIQCSGNNYAKNIWITELRSVNKMVIMETLEEVESRDLAEERERYWIRHFEMLQEPIANIHKTSSPRRAKKTNLRTGREIIDLLNGGLVEQRLVELEARIIKLNQSAETAVKVVEAAEVKGEKFTFTPSEVGLVKDLYRAYGNIDKVLKHMERGARWHKDASRILKDAGLL